MSNMNELIKCVESLLESKGEKGIETFNPNLLEFEDETYSRIEFYFKKGSNGEIIKVDNQEPYVYIDGYRIIKNNKLRIFVDFTYIDEANKKTINGSEWSCGSVNKLSYSRDITTESKQTFYSDNYKWDIIARLTDSEFDFTHANLEVVGKSLNKSDKSTIEFHLARFFNN